MSEFKGTPGPWTVDTTSTFGAYGVWTDYATHPGHDGAGYGSQICSMFTVSFSQTDRTTRPERDANARLIAAAPDLLAALEMVDHCTVVKDGINGQQMWLTHQAVIDAVKAAIFKATRGA